MLLTQGSKLNWMVDLPEGIVAAIERSCTHLSLKPGDNVYHRNDSSACLYQVLSGRLRVRNYSNSGKELLVGYLIPGDCFGEMGLIDGLDRVNDIDAEFETTLAMLPGHHFNRLREIHREIDQQLMIMLCRRSRLIFDLHDRSFLMDFPRRLASRLCDLATLQLKQHSSAPPELKTSHEDLGKFVGASRQSVSTAIKGWEREGLLQQKYGKILLLKITELKDFSES